MTQQLIVLPETPVSALPEDVVVIIDGVRGDWQEKFLKSFLETIHNECEPTVLEKILPHLKIFVTMRWGDNHPLAQWFLPSVSREEDCYENLRIGEITWERQYMQVVMQQHNGSRIIFGLFGEEMQDATPQIRDFSEAYAPDVLGDVREWMLTAESQEYPCVHVGYENGFWSSETMVMNLEARLSRSTFIENVNPYSSPESFGRIQAQHLLKSLHLK